LPVKGPLLAYVEYTEMEFLDINLTKHSSLLLHAIHNPFYWGILKKMILLFGFKILTKNPRNKKTRVYSRIAFVEQGRKPDKNPSPIRLEFMPRNLDQKFRS
jgi:hypothetical protein